MQLGIKENKGQIRTIWIIKKGEKYPRLVTAYGTKVKK